jgi:hypothetical protein
LKKHNWNYGNLTPSQAERQQRELIKMLDLQCENEKLLWKVTTMEVDAATLITQM